MSIIFIFEVQRESFTYIIGIGITKVTQYLNS
jgi:hypothetical protein